jgi:hypothetical protein
MCWYTHDPRCAVVCCVNRLWISYVTICRAVRYIRFLGTTAEDITVVT